MDMILLIYRNSGGVGTHHDKVSKITASNCTSIQDEVTRCIYVILLFSLASLKLINKF